MAVSDVVVGADLLSNSRADKIFYWKNSVLECSETGWAGEM
jgi:hypothetical protein